MDALAAFPGENGKKERSSAERSGDRATPKGRAGIRVKGDRSAYRAVKEARAERIAQEYLDELPVHDCARGENGPMSYLSRVPLLFFLSL